MKNLLLVLLIACSSQKAAPSEPAATARPAAAPAATPAAATAKPPEPSAPAAAAAPVAKGSVATKHFKSAALGVEKTYLLYLPAGYDTDAKKRYPVFYYL